MMKKILPLLFLLIVDPTFAADSEAPSKKEIPHYCDDIEKWDKWVSLIEKYPNDDDLMAVYALRIGLCEEVKRGTIETDRAITIFDSFFWALKAQTNIDAMREKQRNSKK